MVEIMVGTLPYTCFLIVNGDDEPVETEGNICVFTEEGLAMEYNTFYAVDGSHRVVPCDSNNLPNKPLCIDPTLD